VTVSARATGSTRPPRGDYAFVIVIAHLRLLSGLALLLVAGCSGPHPLSPTADAPPARGTGPSALVTFRVAVPSDTPAADTVFVAGSFQGWNPGSAAHALTRQPDGRWTLALDLVAGSPIEFKFTRGSWARVEKGPNGEELANRSLTPQAGQTYDFTVARWADFGTLTGHVESFTWAPFLGGRRVWVYLPPGYDAGTDRYPVLYMHDGQNLFDIRTSFAGEWKVDEACESLIAGGTLRPLIVVGIENAGASRITEYTPWPDPGYGGGGADAYLATLRDVLIPEVDRRYRTLAGPNFRWMAGSSLGGLVSLYAGLAYSETWTRVAALSPSLWWDDHQLLAWSAGRSREHLARVYQDMGTAEGSAQYVQDLRDMRARLIEMGFSPGVDLMHVEAAGAAHNEAYWALRTPGMLQFLAGAYATAGVP
jgi:predicted alpha/beta superfamily hydrolase